jgi:hypothetical protein
MASLSISIESLLRGRTSSRSTGVELLAWLGWIGVGGCLYGAVMGMFGGVTGERIWQVIYSSAKVPLLLWVTFLLTVPSFFVLNSLLGLRDDFAHVWQALLRSQSASAVILLALAPYTALWYLTSGNYNEAILFNALMFAAASVAAQKLLRQAYRPLVARNPRHRLVLRSWIMVYAFVGIQMGWVLRPFIGDPNAPTRFFREEAWGNAYVILAELIYAFAKGFFK